MSSPIESMVQNPNFTDFQIKPDVLQKAGLVAHVTMKLLREQGNTITFPPHHSDGFHEFTSKDGRYHALALPTSIDRYAPLAPTTLGTFANVRNYLRDSEVTVTVKKELQYSPDPADLADHVIKMAFAVPGPDFTDGQWTGITAGFETDGQPNVEAEAAFLQDQPTALDFQVSHARRAAIEALPRF